MTYSALNLTHSPITAHHFAGIDFYLKRDDRLHPQFNGNKARKLYALLQAPLPEVQQLVSYGSPQANSLYSMAALAHLRGWQFTFYVHHIPRWLAENPSGNYQAALALGVHILPTTGFQLSPAQYIAQYLSPNPELLILNEGGHSPWAEAGITQLANEILHWCQSQPHQAWRVALPSGTGTTACYLNKVLAPQGIEVITCACVGDETYLKQQILALGETTFPTILPTLKKHHFGRLYLEEYQLWSLLSQTTGVEFDLLYDPLMWQLLLDWLPQQAPKSLLYIHQGGLLGNVSMQARYRHWQNK